MEPKREQQVDRWKSECECGEALAWLDDMGIIINDEADSEANELDQDVVPSDLPKTA